MKKFFVIVTLGLICMTTNNMFAQCEAQYATTPNEELSLAEMSVGEITPDMLAQFREAGVESAEYQEAVHYFASHPDRITAGILAILLGDLGVQHFYTGQIGRGIVDILFCWTGIPAIVGLIEGVIWLCESDGAFYDQIYGR